MLFLKRNFAGKPLVVSKISKHIWNPHEKFYNFFVLRFFAKGTLKRAVMNQTWYCNNAGPSLYCQYVCSTRNHRLPRHEKHALILARVHAKNLKVTLSNVHIFLTV